MKRFSLFVFFISAAFLSGCSDGPGPLKGRWKLEGIMPITVEYRDSEEESMGLISDVSYSREGRDILITYESGMAKGNTVRVTLKDADTAVTAFGTMRRIR